MASSDQQQLFCDSISLLWKDLIGAEGVEARLRQNLTSKEAQKFIDWLGDTYSDEASAAGRRPISNSSLRLGGTHFVFGELRAHGHREQKGRDALRAEPVPATVKLKLFPLEPGFNQVLVHSFSVPLLAAYMRFSTLRCRAYVVLHTYAPKCTQLHTCHSYVVLTTIR